PCRGCARPPLFRTNPRLARASRHAPWAGAMGGVRRDRQQRNDPAFAEGTRGLSRHLQPRLLHHQARALDHGRDHPAAGDRRYRIPSRWATVMGYAGLILLGMIALGIVFTGLPAVMVLIAVAGAGALFGVLAGAIPLSLLSALPNRLVNLLENDLLQA